MKVQHLHLTKKRIVLLFFTITALFSSYPASAGPGKAGDDAFTQEISLLEAIYHISERYQVLFNYDRAIVEDIMVQYEPSTSQNVDEAITSVLKDTGLKYHMFSQRYIVLYKNDEEGIKSLREMIRHFQNIVDKSDEEVAVRRNVPPAPKLTRTLPESLLKSKALSISIEGTVTDQAGEPLIGVNIQVKGTDKGTATDFEGRFTLEDIDENAVLVVSYVGYQTQEVPVAGKSSLIIMLVSDSQLLDEVVVVGYGTQKKVNLTGAVATIGEKELEGRPITNTSSALQGTLPGVAVVQRSGQPGKDEGVIRIRGIGTMNNASPLIVVDGMEEASMENLNPNDIENISVLKDASAAAIYGSRAANGVIIITTKRGYTGEPRINYDGYMGIQRPTFLPDFLGSYEYAKLLNEGLRNEGSTPRFTDEDIEKFRTGSDPENYPNTDWLDLFYQGSGFQQFHNISISGGQETGRYYVSLGYLDQKGIVKRVNSNRYNIRLNLDSKVSDRLSIGLTSSLSKQYNEEPTGANGSNLGGIMIHANRIPPTIPVKYSDGSWTRYFEGSPIAWVEEGGLRSENLYNIMTNLFAEYLIMTGLKLRGSLGVVYDNLDRNIHVKDIVYGDGFAQGPNSVTEYFDRGLRTIPQLRLSYEKDFNNHSLKGLVGASRNSYRNDYNNSFRKNFPSNDLTELNAGSLEGMSNSGSSYETKLASYFGRINYIFNNKYLFEVSLRADGSSKFAEDRRWGVFPSASLGWRLSEEDFIQGVDIIDDLKIRGSYGTLGNNSTDDYLYINRIALGQNYPFGGNISSGAAQVLPSSPFLQWERAITFDLGFDLSMFKNRINLTADYYNRYTDNILIEVPVSEIYGLPAPTVNGGAMRNTGFEFQVEHVNSLGPFYYNVALNFGVNKSITEKFPNPSLGSRIYAEGEEWGAFYGYEYIGFYQTDEQVDNAPKVPGSPVQKGDLMFKDQNNDGVIDGDDRVPLGSDIPSVPYGINVDLRYKNFDLKVFGQGAAGVYQYLAPYITFPFRNGYKAQRADLDRWTPSTPNASNPITHVNQSHNYNNNSSFMTRNSSYFRMKNLQLGYTFSTLSGINQLRLYFSGQNIFTLLLNSEFQDRGVDPEGPTNGYHTYPNVKVFTAGINLKL